MTIPLCGQVFWHNNTFPTSIDNSLLYSDVRLVAGSKTLNVFCLKPTTFYKNSFNMLLTQDVFLHTTLVQSRGIYLFEPLCKLFNVTLCKLNLHMCGYPYSTSRGLFLNALVVLHFVCSNKFTSIGCADKIICTVNI